MAEKKLKQSEEQLVTSSLIEPAIPTTEANQYKKYRLFGRLERCDAHGITGWLALENETRPLMVELFIDGLPINRTLANTARPDLAIAGVETENHGFFFDIPHILTDGKSHFVSVKEAATGAEIPGSPLKVMAKPDAIETQTHQAPFGKLPVIGEAGRVIEPGIIFDQMIGPISYGWSVSHTNGSDELILSYGTVTLGKIAAGIPRPDVQSALGIERDTVGFQLMSGGLLQFSARTNSLRTVILTQNSVPGSAINIDLASFLDQSYTFAPLKSFARNGRDLGKMCSASCSPNGDFTLLFEAGVASLETESFIGLYFYQEVEDGKLARLKRFDIPLTGQLARMEIKLLETAKPLLIVVCNALQEVILTDCFPNPVLYFEKYAPLVEYHSLLANGQPTFDVIAKISRSYLDYWADKHSGKPSEQATASRERTAVVIFSSGDLDFRAEHIAHSLNHLSDHIAFLHAHGTVSIPGRPEQLTLQQYVEQSKIEYYLLCEVSNVLRPDFWSIFHASQPHPITSFDVLYWESIWIDGINRPMWVKNDVPTGSAFVDEELVPLGSALFSRKMLLQIDTCQIAALTNGCLQLQNLIASITRKYVHRLPAVMDIRRVALTPTMIQRMQTHQQVFPQCQPFANVSKVPMSREVGVSVIVNFRNSSAVTIDCLKSISLQDFNYPVEIILVDNGSTDSENSAVHSEAVRLFGAPNVKIIRYTGRFNHSKQCNIAAHQASHEFLFMLSNDSVLISKDVIARSVLIASMPDVGTCGFRIIKAHGDSQKLVSLGLAITNNKYLFAGAAPLSTHRPPNGLLQYTQGTNGNTFAAVMLRKSVYEKLEGLDENEFPTDYNDVDFCLRATNAGYSHFTIGGALISHNGRGSREMNLDLPINPVLISRMPALATMSQTFSVRML